MRSNRSSMAVWRLTMAAILLLMLAGCGSDRNNRNPQGGLQSADNHELFDRDTRNNEDNTLGVKSHGTEDLAKPDNPGAFRQRDFNNRHFSRTLRFAPEVAQAIKQTPGIQEALVLITEVNAYVGVVPDGRNPDKEAHPDMMAHQYTSKGGLGLFGTDNGNTRINWDDPGGLNHLMSSRIRDQALMLTQPEVDMVFVSANPNFVQRLRFYASEGEKGMDLSSYMNEFNTMIMRVFPSNTNTRR